MASLRFFVCFFLLCASSLTLVYSRSPPKNHVALFILGDSLFDPGNNNYINTIARANYWPYGETFFKYPTGRFSDGRIIPDFIAEYANLPLIPPYLQPGNHQFIYGVNFASAGAGALAESNQGLVIDLKTQLSNFKNVTKLLGKKLGDAQAKTLFSKAVYLINIGGNDYMSPFTTNSSVLQSLSKEEYVGMVIGNLTDTIKEIYKKGGRKFGLLNLGPLGCAPIMKVFVPGNTGSCFEEATELAKVHNAALSKALQELKIKLEGFKYAKHDFNISSSERLNNPEKYAEYANLPLIQPYLQPGNHQFTYGVNFASAGAGALAETAQGFVIDLKTQLSYFKNVTKLLRQKLGDAEAKTLFSKAVYLINIGANDILSPFTTNSSVFQSLSKEEYVGMVIGNITDTIKEIYKKGGRKFGLSNLGALGCIPGMKVLVPGITGSCFEEATELAKLHNAALSKALQELAIKLEGFKYAKHDIYTSSSERTNNPEKYGFKEAEIACCGSGPYRGIDSCGGIRVVTEYELCADPSEYWFFDSGHLTEKAYKQLAELMWSGTPNITGPYNLKALFEA
ncbi:hypothetical protein SCA6_019769 [Theobroma cacao]